MNQVLIITGACGVGKTTLARAWATIKKGATVECDYFTEWIHDPEFPHWTEEEEKLTAIISAKVASEYLDFGMSVVIENVWTPLGIKIIKNHLQEIQNVKIMVVRLICSSEENHQRDEQRTNENQMKERIDVVAGELAAYDWPKDIFLLDTTNMDVHESLEIIEKI